MYNNIKYSIICATINRSNVIEKCIDSIIGQSYTNYEIIVVDQSKDEKTKDIIERIKARHKDIELHYIHTDRPGLSRARNIGIKRASGDYICLMDDDAEYDVNFLSVASQVLNNDKDIKILCGLIMDKANKRTFLKGMTDWGNMQVGSRDVFNVCSSASLVISKDLIDLIGGFDEAFGVGALYGSTEEVDFIFRALYEGARILYVNDMVVYHPHQTLVIDEKARIRAYSYGIGVGAFCRKHLKYNESGFVIMLFLKWMIRSLGGLVLHFFNTEKRRYYFSVLKGRTKGFLMYDATVS